MESLDDNFTDFPSYMWKPCFNLVILCAEEDEEDVEKVQKMINKFGRYEYNDRIYCIKVAVLSDIDRDGYATRLNEAVRASTCVALYLSDNFKVYNEEGNERGLDCQAIIQQNTACGEQLSPSGKPRPIVVLYPLPKESGVDPGPFLRGLIPISLVDLIAVENGIEQFSTEHMEILENELKYPDGIGKKRNRILKQIERVITHGQDRWLKREEDKKAERERREAEHVDK